MMIVFAKGKLIMMKNNDIQMIYNRKIALQLRDMGNVIYDAIPNAKHKGLIVFIFKNTEKLQQDLNTIFN